MLQRQQQQRFPPITKPQRYKFLQDVTQQPYRVDNNNCPIQIPDQLNRMF